MLIRCPVPGKDKSVRLIDAFVKGAPRNSEGYVFYGVKDANRNAWCRARTDEITGRADYYLIDNAYFDATRGQRFRVTRNRLQVNARELTSDGARFDALGLEIKPWRHVPDGYWLAVHQSDDHSHSAPGHKRWMAETLASLSKSRAVMHRAWSRDKPALAQTLPQALEGAWGLVTHTSAAAVTAVLAGVTCIVSEQHALAGMACSPDPEQDQRRRFLSVLADHEFDISELENGTAWRTLNP